MYTLKDIFLYREKYGRKRLILDTNLLILLLVGVFDKKFLGNCRATEKYSEDDYDLILKIFQCFESQIVITPRKINNIMGFWMKLRKEMAFPFWLIALMMCWVN